MNILTVHNRYKIRGGEDESRESEDRLMIGRGHRVLEYIKDNDEIDGNIRKIKAGFQSVWNHETYRDVRQICVKDDINLVDVHNFSPIISPSVHYAAWDSGIPSIQTLHNFRLLCLNALFFREGRICQDCLGKTPIKGIIHSCYKDSISASAALLASTVVHRNLETWTRRVSTFVCLTEFSRQQFIKGGLPESRIYVKPNFVENDPGIGSADGGYFIFVGRLTPEKGIKFLIDSWKMLDKEFKLIIIGEGPLYDWTIEQSSGLDNIKVLGKLPLIESYEYISNATALIFPSLWFETFGRVAIEAYAMGIPVIASNLGGAGEIIEDGRTGFLISPGDSEELNAAVKTLQGKGQIYDNMRKNARQEYASKYSADVNYQKIMQLYDFAIKNHNKMRNL